MGDPVVELLSAAKISIMLKQPFFGHLIITMPLEEQTGDWLSTAATDGRKIYYNRDFIIKLVGGESKLASNVKDGLEYVKFLLAHEISHCIFEHVGHVDTTKDHRIMNYACDFMINDMLVKSNVGKMPEIGLLSSTYTSELTSHEIYNLLIKNQSELNLLLSQGKGLLDEHLDVRVDENDNGDDNGDSKGNKDGKGNIKSNKPVLSEEDLNDIKAEIRSRVLSAVASSDAGDVPAAIKRFVNDLIEPKLNWKELLDNHIKSSFRIDTSYSQPHRHSSAYGNFILPGKLPEETIDIVVAIDTSGSMSNEMVKEILSEVKGIMEQYNCFKLTVFTFDTRVYNLQEFDNNNQDEIYNYEPIGGGGTMFECVFDFMREESIEPKRLVFFTDGYPCGTWGDPNFCETLFVIHGDNRVEPPFGMAAYYDDAK